MSTTSATPDLRPVLLLALDQVGELIDRSDPQKAQQPTPCAEFDVQGLIEHLQAVVRRIAVVLSGGHFGDVPHQVASTDWSRDWAAGRSELAPILADDDNLARRVTVPWGEALGAEALGMYVGELSIHAWDLAAATGRTELLDPTLAEGVLPAYRRSLPAEPRGGDIPFDAVVEVPADAGAYEQLVAWSGRDPQWRWATAGSGPACETR